MNDQSYLTDDVVANDNNIESNLHSNELNQLSENNNCDSNEHLNDTDETDTKNELKLSLANNSAKTRTSSLSNRPDSCKSMKNKPNNEQLSSDNSSSLSSSATSSLSLQSSALPQISFNEIDKCRYFLGSNAFFESYFGQSELERFFPNHKIRLAIITWNMNSKPPINYNESLQELLHLKSYQQREYDQINLPELFIVGLQEAPTSEVIIDNIKIGIQAVLGPNYVLLRWSSIGVLHCSVWIRRELLWSCTKVEMVPIHTRPVAANRIRTKGAIALSFSLFGTSFIFINTHLNAHEINLRARMNQLDKVQHILNNKYPSGKLKSSSENYLPILDNNNSNKNIINEKFRDRNSEYIFWFGDLNFRLELPSQVVLDSIKQIKNANNSEFKCKLLLKLLRSDQLTNLMNRGLIFNGFEEAQWPPNFLPTYKCKMVNHRNDTKTDFSSNDHLEEENCTNFNDEPDIIDFYNVESGRVPSYTDRILFQSKMANNDPDVDESENRIKCIHYNSINSLTSSDHKPVYAMFETMLDGSGGGAPKLGLTIKRLSQLIDDVYVNKLSNIKNVSKLIKRKNKNKLVEENEENEQQMETKRNLNLTGNWNRLLNRNRNLFKKNSSKQETILNQSNENEHSKSSKMDQSNSINANYLYSIDSAGVFDRINQLNAGAYERRIYLDGLRQRDNYIQNISIQEMKYRQNKYPLERFKSRSFEWNVFPVQHNKNTNDLLSVNDGQSNKVNHKLSSSTPFLPFSKIKPTANYIKNSTSSVCTIQ